MNQPNQLAFTQVLSREQVKLVNLHMMVRPTNPNPLVLTYHLKSGRLFDLYLAKPLRQISNFDCR